MNIATSTTTPITNGNAGRDTRAEVVLAQDGLTRLAPVPMAREQIVRRVSRAGAFPLEELYDAFVRQSFSLAYRMLGQSSVAVPAMQEAFEKLWVCWVCPVIRPVIRPEINPANYSAQEGWFQSWLLNVTHNKCLAELRLLRVRHPEVAPEAIEQSVAANLVDIMVDAALSAADRKLSKKGQPPLQQVVEHLASAQRQVLELAYLRGLSQAQIAVELRQPLSAVKFHTRMALRELHSLSRSNSQGRRVPVFRQLDRSVSSPIVAVTNLRSRRRTAPGE